MEPRPGETLELLLPKAGPARLERARRVVTFLRLLVDDTRARSGETVGLGLERARTEMSRLHREGLLELLEDLLRHHLRASLDPASFVDLGEPRRGSQEAWSEVERHRGSGLDLPGLPAPGEGPLEVAERLLEAARGLGGDPDRRAAHRAALRRCVAGPVEGERAWRELLEAPRAEPLSHGLEAVCVQGVAECRLDRGAVRRAHAWLDERLGLVSAVPRLRWLLAWTQLLLDDAAAAKETVLGLEPGGGALPAALVELRERMPAWRRLLPGDPAPAAERWDPARAPRPDREGIGAALLAVFALDPPGAARAIHVEAAPGLRSAVEPLGSEGEGPRRVSLEPDHRLLVECRAVMRHRTRRAPLEGAVGGAATLALVQQPILDEEGELGGWVHVECEHHLLPPASRLEAIAAAWRGRLAPAPEAGAPAGAHGRAARSPDHPSVETALAARDPRARVARLLVRALGMKSTMRRWWCFDLERGSPTLAAQGGGALEDWPEAGGGGRALRRAVAAATSIRFTDREPDLSLHASSGSGLAVPLVERGKVRAVLAVESTRRRDFREGDVERLGRTARAFAARWRTAQFRAWHVARFGHDVHLDPDGLGFGRLLRDLPVTGGARSPVALVGAEGVGKEILARWIHFEGEDPEGPCEPYACGAGSPGELGRTLLVRERASLLGRFERGGTGTLILDELESLAPALQIRLRDHLLASARRDRREAGPRPVATLRRPLAELVADGLLRADLASPFQRLELAVPPLRDRRDEIPSLVRLLASRFAHEEELAIPRLDDAALALLWRQPWTGNVRELEGLLYKLVVFHPGQPVSVEIVRSLAGRFGLEIVERLPSRRPRAADGRAALRATRHVSGSVNKTRAALYLGWDPDTLAARLRDTILEPAEE